MCKKCILVFLSGAAAWEAVVHTLFLLGGSETSLFGIQLTKYVNIGIIGGAAIICVALLYLAHKVRCSCPVAQ